MSAQQYSRPIRNALKLFSLLFIIFPPETPGFKSSESVANLFAKNE